MACEDEEARDIVDKICEEFGPLSRIQACKIEERISQGGVGYVLEKAEVVRQMVRSKPFEEPSDEQLTKDRAAIAAMKATVRDA